MAQTASAYMGTVSATLARMAETARDQAAETKALTQTMGIMLEVQQGQGEMLSRILDLAAKEPAPSKMPDALKELSAAIEANTLVLSTLLKRIEGLPGDIESRVASGVHAAMHDGELPA